MDGAVAFQNADMDYRGSSSLKFRCRENDQDESRCEDGPKCVSKC